MRRPFSTVMTVFVVLILTPVVWAQRSSSRPAQQTIKLQSALLGTVVPYQVVLPRDYRTSPATRYPVLYLLHGLSGHYDDWVTRTNIADYAARYKLIIVMPEGDNGWYTDSAGVPNDKYESYILQELIPDVEQRFRTIKARYGRAIAGLSMGGYGAFKFALKYPDRFAFAASMSGAFGVTRYTEKDTSSAAWDDLLRRFGPVGSPTRQANDLLELVHGLTAANVAGLPYFYFDCGTEDSRSIFSANRELSEALLQKKIPHEFRELPGNHSWEYWNQQIQEVLRLAAHKLRIQPLLN